MQTYPRDMDIELPDCPICGKKALVIHLYDTYDRADFGWTAVCCAARRADRVHGFEWEMQMPPEDYPSVDAATKQGAIDAWISWVQAWKERHGES